MDTERGRRGRVSKQGKDRADSSSRQNRVLGNRGHRLGLGLDSD